MGLPKHTHESITAANTAMMRCCIGFEALSQSTESPIFDAHFWPEHGISCPYERNKIGDSVLCFVVCKRFARWAYKNTRMRTLQRCVAISGLMLFFGKIFARWVYIYTRIESITATIRCYIGFETL
jgi:hypothetical protein